MWQYKRISTDFCEVFKTSELVLIQIKRFNRALFASLLAWVLVIINGGQILKFLVREVILARARDKTFLFLLLSAILELVYPDNCWLL